MTRFAWSLSLTLTLLCALTAHGDDWRQFRGPTGQGISRATGLPVQWSKTKNVVWKTEIPGNGWSSPIVVGERVLLTTAVALDDAKNGRQSLRALSLDAETGEVEWNVEVFQQPPSAIHNKNSHASPTAVSDGNVVYVHFGTHGTACLTLEGAEVWKTQKLKYDPRHGSGGSPVLLDDQLIVACDGADVDFLIALDRHTGETNWKTMRTVSQVRKFAFSTPLAIEVDGRTQIVAPCAGFVGAYRPEDGSEIWSVKYPGGYSVVPRPVFGHGLVYVCTGWNVPSLLAIRPDGQGDVTDTHIEWSTRRGAPKTPSLLLVDEEIYSLSDRGVFSCRDAGTGELHWMERVDGNFSASPLYADGKIYLQSEQGEGIVLKAGKQYEELARNQLEPRTFASYAVADQSLLIRTEVHLYRIGQERAD